MKTVEQLLNEKGVTPETMHHNYDYAYRAVCDIIAQAQKESYNQAIDDAMKNAEAKIDVWYDYDDKAHLRGEVIVDKESILKLKK